MNPPTGTRDNRLSGVEARLLELDPDFEELFAEVDEALCAARILWLPRLRTTVTPQRRTIGFRPPTPRLRSRRPTRLRARERGPPEHRRLCPAAR